MLDQEKNKRISGLVLFVLFDWQMLNFHSRTYLRMGVTETSWYREKLPRHCVYDTPSFRMSHVGCPVLDIYYHRVCTFHFDRVTVYGIPKVIFFCINLLLYQFVLSLYLAYKKKSKRCTDSVTRNNANAQCWHVCSTRVLKILQNSLPLASR